MRRITAALCLVLWLFMCPAGYAQEAAWELQLGEGGDYLPAAMAQSSGDQLFIVGTAPEDEPLLGEPLGGEDGFVLCVSQEGEVLWSGRFGGSKNDAFHQVLALSDGGCIAVGSTESEDGHARAARGSVDAFMVRLDSEGGLVWSKCLGGTYEDEILDIRVNEEGLLYVCGKTKSRNGDFPSNQGGWDAWVAQLFLENGKPEWLKTYGTPGDDQFVSMIISYDGLVALGQIGEEGANGEIRPYPTAVSLNMAGEQQWESTVGTGVNNLLMHWVESSSGWILSGNAVTASALMPTYHGRGEIWTLKLDVSGSVAWQRCYGGSGNETAYALSAAENGNYLILGITESQNGQVSSNHGGKDLWVICVNSAGVLKWEQTVGGSRDSAPVGMALMPSGEIWVAGSSTAQDGDIGRHPSACTGFLTRLAVNGNLLETTLIGGRQECQLTDMLQGDTGVYLVGTLRTIENGEIRQDLYLTYFEEEMHE